MTEKINCALTQTITQGDGSVGTTQGDGSVVFSVKGIQNDKNQKN